MMKSSRLASIFVNVPHYNLQCSAWFLRRSHSRIEGSTTAHMGTPGGPGETTSRPGRTGGSRNWRGVNIGVIVFDIRMLSFRWILLDGHWNDCLHLMRDFAGAATTRQRAITWRQLILLWLGRGPVLDDRSKSSSSVVAALVCSMIWMFQC